MKKRISKILSVFLASAISFAPLTPSAFATEKTKAVTEKKEKKEKETSKTKSRKPISDKKEKIIKKSPDKKSKILIVKDKEDKKPEKYADKEEKTDDESAPIKKERKKLKIFPTFFSKKISLHQTAKKKTVLASDDEKESDDVVKQSDDEETITITDRFKKARLRQEKREAGTRGFRFLSQVYTAYTDMNYAMKHVGTLVLKTPFGDVTFKLSQGTKQSGRGTKLEIMVIDDRHDKYVAYKYKYTYFCKCISKTLNKKGQQELAQIILNYLRTPVDGTVEISDFFENLTHREDILIGNPTRYDIDEAKKSVALLCGILFISEPGPNRMFDGGKSARAAINLIVKGEKTFYDVFVNGGNGCPLYTISKEKRKNKRGKKITLKSGEEKIIDVGGAILARIITTGISDSYNNFNIDELTESEKSNFEFIAENMSESSDSEDECYKKDEK